MMDTQKSLENGKIPKDSPAATGSSLSSEELERILKTGTAGLSQLRSRHGCRNTGSMISRKRKSIRFSGF